MVCYRRRLLDTVRIGVVLHQRRVVILLGCRVLALVRVVGRSHLVLHAPIVAHVVGVR